MKLNMYFAYRLTGEPLGVSYQQLLHTKQRFNRCDGVSLLQRLVAYKPQNPHGFK